MATKCARPTALAIDGAVLLHPAVNPETSEVLALFPSASRPGSAHACCKSRRNGDLWCTCPAWRFQRIPATERTCKHLKALAGSALGSTGPSPVSKHDAAKELGSARKADAKRIAAHKAYRASIAL
jgi:hypothetical protein